MLIVNRKQSAISNQQLTLKLFNSLTNKIEEFKPINPPFVGMYTCGPTVYDYAHIGNLRTYIFSDLVRRTLIYLGYKVKSVMNITDVGHLVSDSDEGEDKLEKGAKREKKTAWEIAKKYTEFFLTDINKLNILVPNILCQATEHIPEQIQLIQTLEEKGFTYNISDGIYFDTSKFPHYGELAKLDLIGQKEGARVERNREKKNSSDFALWKFSPPTDGLTGGKKRDMEWQSPWGKGFPGWHIECSAMSTKYLGETFDLHLGGVDLKPIHHTNEIAQSEAATEKKFVNYFLHGEFLLVDGEKMSKSKGNFYHLDDLINKGFDFLALRYFYLTCHYRKQLNFTWQGLEASQNALNKLRELGNPKRINPVKSKLTLKENKWKEKFIKAIAEDFNFPQALAVVWEVVRSKLSPQVKQKLLLDFDKVLGLDLGKVEKVEKVEDKIKTLINQREKLRKEGKWQEADGVRNEIEKKGYVLEDTTKGTKIKKQHGKTF